MADTDKPLTHHPKELTFGVTRTIPLTQLTGDPTDEYANIRQYASVTMEMDTTASMTDAQRGEIVRKAFSDAEDYVTEQLTQFYNAMVEAFKPKKSR